MVSHCSSGLCSQDLSLHCWAVMLFLPQAVENTVEKGVQVTLGCWFTLVSPRREAESWAGVESRLLLCA